MDTLKVPGGYSSWQHAFTKVCPGLESRDPLIEDALHRVVLRSCGTYKQVEGDLRFEQNLAICVWRQSG